MLLLTSREGNRKLVVVFLPKREHPFDLSFCFKVRSGVSLESGSGSCFQKYYINECIFFSNESLSVIMINIRRNNVNVLICKIEIMILIPT